MSKQEIIKAMEIRGYYYDEFSSYDGLAVFSYNTGRIYFHSWEDVADWLDGVVWEELASND